MKTYLFFREDGFYPVQYKDDKSAIVDAIHNKGTIKLENDKGDVIWQSFSSKDKEK